MSQNTTSHSSGEAPAHIPAVPRPRWWQLGLILLALGTGLGGLYYTGMHPRQTQNSLLATESQRVQTALPRVQLIAPKPAPAESTIVLPGDVQAVEETTIYPRTSGYLKKRYVDIGDQVTEGQLLAEIDTPEIDQQRLQTEATLEQLRARKKTAETSHQLALATLRRVESVPSGIITMQEIDERRAQVETAASAISAAEADIAAGVASVQRIKELQSFSKVYAPFPGTITSRSVELGQLVTAGNDTAQSLFRLARTNPVRIFINVPQIYAPAVQAGLAAELIVRELPSRKFEGKVTRTAGAIDAITRTLRTEVQIPNDDQALLVGSYVQVKLNVRRENPPLLIPASALVFNADGAKVAVVNADHEVELRAVEVDGDFGAELGIGRGLSASESIVVNPGDRLATGMKVIVDPAAAVATPNGTAPAPAHPAKTETTDNRKSH